MNLTNRRHCGLQLVPSGPIYSGFRYSSPRYSGCLKAAARENHHGNVSKEVTNRLRRSLNANGDRDPTIRALCYLITELAVSIKKNAQKIKSTNDPQACRSGPFFFTAFNPAAAQVLNAPDPPGEIVPPEPSEEFIMSLPNARAEPEEARAEALARVESPQKFAKGKAGYILFMLNNFPSISPEWMEENRDFVFGLIRAQTYAIPDAARDLDFKSVPDVRFD